MSRKRPRNTQPRRDKILVQCEGRDTEPHYLREFRFDPRVAVRFHVTVKEGRGGDAEAVVSMAIAERDRQRRAEDRYDEVWCVLDVEDPTRAAALTRAVVKARREGIHVCLSNPCFEVWLIAHFEAIARPFPDCRAAEQHLKQAHWGTVPGTDYDKADPDLYRKLAHLLPTAVDNARTVLEKHHSNKPCRNCNSSTEVYQLIQKLLPPG